MHTTPDATDHAHAAPGGPSHALGESVASIPLEHAQILELADAPVALPRWSVIRAQGVEPTCIYLLITGWASASVDMEDGGRQITTVHLPGDLMGVPGMGLSETAETLTALTPVVVGRVPLERFGHLFTTSPSFAMAMFLGAQRQHVALMDLLTRIGRKPAPQRMAWLLLDLHARLSAAGAAGASWFDLMLREDEIADVLGITSVHANRVFSQLQKDGLILRRQQRIDIIDPLALAQLADRSRRTVAVAPDWLSWNAAAASSGAPAAVEGTLHLRPDN